MHSVASELTFRVPRIAGAQDSPPITNLGYGNLPEQMCHSGIGPVHCNNNPGLNTGLVPNWVAEYYVTGGLAN